MKIDVFTDGSATIASKPGGFGWVLVVDGEKVDEGNGHMLRGTNNDAEMEAAIHGLAAAFKFISMYVSQVDIYELGKLDPVERTTVVKVEVTLCSDSQITLGWANGTYRFKQEAKYQRFSILKKLMQKMNAKTRWVRGHSGDEHNERCDELANLGRHNLGPNDKLPGKSLKPRALSKTLLLTTIKEIAKVAKTHAQEGDWNFVLSKCQEVLKDV